MKRWWSIALALFAVGCSSPTRPALTVLSDSTVAGDREIGLSDGPDALALGERSLPAIKLVERWNTTAVDHPNGATIVSAGKVIVSDLAEHRLLVLGPDGNITDSLGRQGEGPGEFLTLFGPVAVAMVGHTIVALQGATKNTLVAFPASSRPTASGPPVEGDWMEYLFRQPDLGVEVPKQSGPELWSRRLQSLDSTSAALIITPATTGGRKGGLVVLRRLHPDLTLGDTLATWPIVPLFELAARDREGSPEQSEQIWSGRPLWAAEDGSLLVAHGDSSRLTVRDVARGRTLVVRWPVVLRVTTSDDQFLYADALSFGIRATTKGAEENASKLSANELREMMGHFLATRRFAPTAPALSSAWLAGGCVLLSGWDPAASVEGTAARWVVVDPTSVPATLTMFTLRPYERILAASAAGILTVQIEESGERRLQMYQAPVCRAA